MIKKEHQKDFERVLHNITTDILNEYGDKFSFTELKHMIQRAVNCAIDECMNEAYYRVKFNSPMGMNTENLLRDCGFDVEWDGRLGYRGNTTIYFKKDKYDLDTVKQTQGIIEALDKIKQNNIQMFDKDTIITIEE